MLLSQTAVNRGMMRSSRIVRLALKVRLVLLDDCLPNRRTVPLVFHACQQQLNALQCLGIIEPLTEQMLLHCVVVSDARKVIHILHLGYFVSREKQQESNSRLWHPVIVQKTKEANKSLHEAMIPSSRDLMLPPNIPETASHAKFK